MHVPDEHIGLVGTADAVEVTVVATFVPEQAATVVKAVVVHPATEEAPEVTEQKTLWVVMVTVVVQDAEEVDALDTSVEEPVGVSLVVTVCVGFFVPVFVDVSSGGQSPILRPNSWMQKPSSGALISILGGNVM